MSRQSVIILQMTNAVNKAVCHTFFNKISIIRGKPHWGRVPLLLSKHCIMALVFFCNWRHGIKHYDRQQNDA